MMSCFQNPKNEGRSIKKKHRLQVHVFEADFVWIGGYRITKQSSAKLTHLIALLIIGGSSNIKFILHQVGKPLKRKLYGNIDRTGLSGTNLACNDLIGNQQNSHSTVPSDHRSAANILINWFVERDEFASIEMFSALNEKNKKRRVKL